MSGRRKRPSGGGRGAAFPIAEALARVAESNRAFQSTTLADLAESTRDPFRVVVGCLLSLRTQDRHTRAACERLFARAATPAALAAMDPAEVERLIHPVGFYKTKAARLVRLAATLLERHGGRVPDTMEGLLALDGVGRKTANLTLTLGFGLPGICVDTHVHRIANRWGYVRTATPDDTEMRLRDILPPEFWIPINDWLVTFGQNICTPLSPHCSTCRLTDLCGRVGVGRRR